MVRKRNKLVSIDTEYNSNGDLLSIGLSNHEFKTDFFIKNKVDKKSYQYHGLPEFFLFENGLNPKEIKNITTSIEKKFDIFIGYDILKDLQVMKFKNISKLYDNNRIIDLKCIMDLYNKPRKLHLLSKDFNIKINSSLNHSSSYDSMITYLLFIEFFKIFSENNENMIDIFIEKLTKLTTAFFWNRNFEIDNLYSDFLKINNKLNSKKYKNKKSEKLMYYIKDNMIVFINNEKKALYRFPYKYIEKNKLKNYKEYQEKIENNIYGIKFHKDLIDFKYKLYSFN